MKWAIELSEFKVSIVPVRAIKGQVVADFIAELTPITTPIPVGTWCIFVDGSTSRSGSGAGVVVISPTGERVEYAI